MPEIHYLRSQHVDRTYPERLTVRGDDVDALIDILQWAAQYGDLSTEEHDFVDRVMKATGRWGHDEWEEPLEED